MYNTKSEPYCKLQTLRDYDVCKFINCNKCVTLVRDVSNGEGPACVREGTYSLASAQFCYKHKIIAKVKSINISKIRKG